MQRKGVAAGRKITGAVGTRSAETFWAQQRGGTCVHLRNSTQAITRRHPPAGISSHGPNHTVVCPRAVHLTSRLQSLDDGERDLLEQNLRGARRCAVRGGVRGAELIEYGGARVSASTCVRSLAAALSSGQLRGAARGKGGKGRREAAARTARDAGRLRAGRGRRIARQRGRSEQASKAWQKQESTLPFRRATVAHPTWGVTMRIRLPFFPATPQTTPAWAKA